MNLCRKSTDLTEKYWGYVMKNRILLKTNLLVCLVIILGFLLTALLGYRANYNASIEKIEQVSSLTSEGIYYQISSTFTKPVNISLTMANDSLLKEFLSQEGAHFEDHDYIDTLRAYLKTYQEKYAYDSVFLVSAATARYYNFNGLDRVLEPGDPENFWYYDDLLQSEEEYSMNVDNDEVEGAENAITVFVNCKIKDSSGALLGVVGVGVRIDSLQQTLQSYQDEYDMTAYLIDETGMIEISTEYTGYEKVNLFEVDRHGANSKQQILEWTKEGAALDFWDLDDNGQKHNYVVARYLPEVQWHLVVERDTSILLQNLNRQLMLTVLVIIFILVIILMIITRVIRRYNIRIVQLTESVERERQGIFTKATEQLFDNIYELDITHNRPANAATENYFESMGVPRGTSYDNAVHIIAEKRIKEEYRQGYLDMFLSKNVTEAFENGQETLLYEFLFTKDGAIYEWMRITARIVKWESDQTLHMLVYLLNIDDEKRQEQWMQQLAETDEMTGFLTKTATQRRIEQILRDSPEECFAFFIFDIDHFKQANDLYGHAFGDSVIRTFAQTIQENFDRNAVLGRLGGDEFAAFFPAAQDAQAEQKLQILCETLNREHIWSDKKWYISASIGAAFAPRDGNRFNMLYQCADAALYETKKGGRGSFTIYHNMTGGKAESEM
ncbi:MAG: diguanylate cyclase domain-containing protein [Clostridia bacterium]